VPRIEATDKWREPNRTFHLSRTLSEGAPRPGPDGCQHLFVSLGSHGLVGEWLQLPTVGTKFLHCTLLNYTIAFVPDDIVGPGGGCGRD
jgi:hypothetical protein